jgi:HEAT repeat protein
MSDEMLEILFKLGFVGILLVVAAILAYRSSRLGATAALRRLVESCGALSDLRWSESTIGGKSSLMALSGGLVVQLEPYGKGRRTGTRIAISGDSSSTGITLRPAFDQRPDASDVVLGDDDFDRAVKVEGPPALVGAALDAPTRQAVRSLLHGAMDEGWPGRLDVRVVIEAGVLRANVLEEREGALENAMTWLVPRLVETARRLLLDADVPERLGHNARHDPLETVRAQTLAALIRHHRDHPHTGGVLRDACADVSPEVRLRAAQALGAEGEPTLLALAQDERIDETLRARAVGGLAEPVPREAVDTLLATAARGRKTGLAVACAQALGRTGSAAAEPPLLRALAHGLPDLQVAAAQALGPVGTAAAVLPLAEAAEAGSEALRRAARQAVDEIQSRLDGATPGQVSLTEHDQGHVSLTESLDGRVSLRQQAPDARRPRERGRDVT